MHSHRISGLLWGINRRIWVYMFLVVIIWGFTATVEVVALRHLSPLQFALWSTVCGSLGALFYIILRGTTKKLFSYRLSDHGKLFSLAMLGFAGYFFLKYTAYTISPVPQANVLQYTFTIFIVIFAVPVLKQPLTLLKTIGVLVGFTGAAIIITGGTLNAYNTAYLSGYLFALSAGISWALFSVFCEKTSYERLYGLFYFHTYSALIIFLVLVVRGEYAIPTGIKEIGAAAYCGIVSNVVGIYLWLTAQNASDDVSLLTGILFFVPFVSLLCFKVFLNLPIPLYTFKGLALIVGGLMIHNLRSQRKTV